MIRFTALYPRRDGGRFDHDYYENEHRELVLERLSPLGLVRVEMDRGVAEADGGEPPFTAAGHLYFESLEELQDALDAQGEDVMADVPNFTNLEPVVQVARIATP